VAEFRNESWRHKYVYKALSERNITFCGMSYPGLPDNVIENTASVYYHFLGVPNLYRSSYSEEFLQDVVDSVKHNTKLRESRFYFNNDNDAVGVRNVQEKLELI
jgi:uncharacterized protein YecE (DUF72 family)